MVIFNKLWDTMRDKVFSTYILREKYKIDNRTIRRLKANQNITTETLKKLCNILDCNLENSTSILKNAYSMRTLQPAILHDVYYSPSLERKVYEQFKEFIERNRLI